MVKFKFQSFFRIIVGCLLIIFKTFSLVTIAYVMSFTKGFSYGIIKILFALGGLIWIMNEIPNYFLSNVEKEAGG